MNRPEDSKRPHVTFDWSINLGHVLTFAGFLLTIGLAFTALDKRVVVVEQAVAYQTRRDEAQDTNQKELKAEIKEALRDVNASLNRLVDKLDAAQIAQRKK
jgi:hypothetical protein